MPKKKQREILYIYLLMLAVLFVGILIGFNLYTPKCTYVQTIPTEPVKTLSSFSSTINVPAVDNEGNGVSVDLTVESKPGNDRVLTNIDKLLFWVDTQYSIQTAKSVASNITEIDTTNIDLIYTINTNATIVGGPSAGAALTIATIGALENKEMNKSVMITGTINPDGSVGQIGGILEKAKAAKEIGAILFLVPEGQGKETKLLPEEKCTERKNFIFCETKYKQITVDISESAGIRVVEISNIEEAMDYFF